MNERRIGDHESDRLAELLQAFPTGRNLSVIEANRYIRQAFIRIIDSTLEGEKGWLTDRHKFYGTIKLLHLNLFRDVLSNAGQFRQSSDKLQGVVYFGGQDKRTGFPKFHGVITSDIQLKLFEAIDHNLSDTGSALVKSVRFYAQFVRIHPFHDGNGRVGRIILNAMLSELKLVVDWDSLHQKENQFLRRLNRYHVTQMDDDLNRLTDFVSKFVITDNIDELSDP